MTTSYNGWTASASPSAIGVVDFTAAGQSFPAGVRGGDVATVFRALVEFLDAEVEPIRAGWNWGYNFRQTTGGTSLSNHASGTAIDYNAPLHPFDKRGTWTVEQVRKVDAFLADVLDGVVFWGEHYRSQVDGMHFEIADGKTQADVARVAAKITALREDADMASKEVQDQLDRIEKAANEAATQARRAREGSFKRDKRLIDLARQTQDDADTIIRKLEKE